MRAVDVLFQQALGLYQSRSFTAAASAFDTCLSRAPDDGVARLYRLACDRFIDCAPGPDWDGDLALSK